MTRLVWHHGSMARELSDYHQRVADENRAAIVSAAAEQFLRHGYDGTALARIAEDAGVSKATLFKQFPTKDLLFEATVVAVGQPNTPVTDPPAGDLRGGLLAIGTTYADVLAEPRTADVVRLLIAEGPRVVELGERDFDFGALPVIESLRRYLHLEQDAGGIVAGADLGAAAEQFLGMIASRTFWPRLVHPTWSIDAAGIHRVVEDAVETIVARYGQ